MTRYLIEVWNPKDKKYQKLGEYSGIEQAVIMFNKPYNKRLTRRLIKIEAELLYIIKAKKND